MWSTGRRSPCYQPLTKAARGVRTVTIVLNKATLNGSTCYVLSEFPDIMRDLGLAAI